MKIAWYTPFSIDSAIGRYSSLVVRCLRDLGADVRVVRSESRTPAIRSLPPTCREEQYAWAADLDRSPVNQLAEYDLVVYNVGDHYDYHAYCYTHQAQVPGLTILHDYSLHHALYKYCTVGVTDNAGYREHLVAECGSKALDRYDELVERDDESTWWHHDMAQFPVYRWALQSTQGIVTHADFYRQRAATTIGCPTATIPLAYDSPCSRLVAGSRLEISANTNPSGANHRKLRIVTIGAVNVNKRHESVIRVIAESPLLRDRCAFHIVGHVDDAARRRIQRAVAAQKHRVEVVITGRVDRATLQAELEQADIVSCLRFPALEGASASVIESLMGAKPTIVCDTGCYLEIPNEAVYKVSPHREHDELRQALEQIVLRPADADRKAAVGYSWAKERHSAANYARHFLEFAAEVLYNRPVLGTIDRIADQLQQWNVPADEVFLARIDAAARDLFGGNNAQAATRRAA